VQADLRARELFVELLDALGEFPHGQPGDRGQVVVVDPDPERRAGLDQLGRLERAQPGPKLSGAVATTVRSWLTAWMRDLVALRCTIFSSRNASTGPSWAFAVAVA
jgi:hypothetical protein